MTNDINYPAPSVYVLRITPTLAREWLSTNIRNRRVSSVTARRYLTDMLEGRWLFAGDAIRRNAQRHILDGQHRLTAVSMLPEDHPGFDFVIIDGLASATQNVMDQGRVRTAADQLAIAGVKDGHATAAGIRLYLLHSTGMLFRDNSAAAAEITRTRIVEWALTHSTLVESARSIPQLRSNDAPPSVSVCAALMFVERYGVGRATEFFRLLAEGAGAGHPINALDKRLQRTRREGLKVSARDQLAWFILAMNAWNDGRELTKFQAPRGGKWTPENYPQLRAAA